jgi:hypothetical protein
MHVLVHARGAGMWASAHLAAGKAILDGLFVGFGGFFGMFSSSDVFFQIWTIFIIEHFLDLNNFRIWTFFDFEHFLVLNNFQIWTIFIIEQFLILNNFQIWIFYNLLIFKFYFL